MLLPDSVISLHTLICFMRILGTSTNTCHSSHFSFSSSLHTCLYSEVQISFSTSLGSQRVFVTVAQIGTCVSIIFSSLTSCVLYFVTVSHMSTYVVLHEDTILAHTLTITPFPASCSPSDICTSLLLLEYTHQLYMKH